MDKVCVYAENRHMAEIECPSFEDRRVDRYGTEDTVRLDQCFVETEWDTNERALYNDPDALIRAYASTVGTRNFERTVVRDRMLGTGGTISCH